jgi:hypothetical protein
VTAIAESFERAGRLFAAMTEALDAHPERGDERIVTLFTFPRGKDQAAISGMLSHGYDDDEVEAPSLETAVRSDQMSDLIAHLTLLLRQCDVALMLFPVNHD